MNFKKYIFILFFVALLNFHELDAIKLGKYKISKITVSGISSGGAMATQIHVAHSGIISGSGNIAGPPYYCALGTLLTATASCMSNIITLGINMPFIFNKVSSYKSQNLIDNPENLKDDYVYIYSGLSDFVTSTNVVKKNEEFFKNYLNASQIKGVYNINSAHGMITDYFGASCATTSSFFINNCDYNQAFDILQTLHPEENFIMPNKGYNLYGNLIEFEQNEFFTGSLVSLDSAAYIYVPQQCENKECKLHIALHGCLQGKYKVGNVFALNSGYNQVADLNDFIILYPQATNNLAINPSGCWDWWGYTDGYYATQEGRQIKAIKAMIDRIRNQN